MRRILYYEHNLYYLLKRRVKIDYKRFNMSELYNLSAASIRVIDELTSENIKLKSENAELQHELSDKKNIIEKMKKEE